MTAEILYDHDLQSFNVTYFRDYQSFGETCCYHLQVEMSPTTHDSTLYHTCTPADHSLEHQYLSLS